MKLTSNIGKFYIGDPCYVMKNEFYNQWIDKLSAEDGIHEINGLNFATFWVESGDSACEDSNGFIYSIESTAIAIIPFELLNQNREISNFGYVIEAKELEYEYSNGELSINFENNCICIDMNYSVPDDFDD